MASAEVELGSFGMGGLIVPSDWTRAADRTLARADHGRASTGQNDPLRNLLRSAAEKVQILRISAWGFHRSLGVRWVRKLSPTRGGSDRG